MTASMPWKKDNTAPCEFARKQLVRGGAEWCFNRHPFLSGESLYMVESAAADNANSVK